MVLSIAGRNNGRPEAARANKSFTIGTLRCACVDGRCEKTTLHLVPIILRLSRACHVRRFA